MSSTTVRFKFAPLLLQFGFGVVTGGSVVTGFGYHKHRKFVEQLHDNHKFKCNTIAHQKTVTAIQQERLRIISLISEDDRGY